MNSRNDFALRPVLLATELAFASETLGWSRDWSADTGFADRETITVLRSIQGKLAGIVHGADDRVTGSGPQPQPAWSPISMDADDEYWTPFCRRFEFRPSIHSWPAITEPVPSVTVDLGPIFAARSHPEFAAGAAAVNSVTLLALVRALEPGSSLVVLDWQHQTYRFWPHRFACQPDAQWQTDVFPNGDYYIFLTEEYVAPARSAIRGSRRSASLASRCCPSLSRCSQAGSPSNVPVCRRSEPGQELPGRAAARHGRTSSSSGRTPRSWRALSAA